jgi:hypothetical protein
VDIKGGDVVGVLQLPKTGHGEDSATVATLSSRLKEEHSDSFTI